MGRPLRASEGGVVYHVLNRANARRTIFSDADDDMALEAVLAQTVERSATRLLACCVLPNHWHLIVWPRHDGEWSRGGPPASRFVGWRTLTHTQRWRAHRRTAGAGRVYQGRSKSFPIQADDHFNAVARYIERNPLRAGLVCKAEQWRWSSLYRRCFHAADATFLAPWPLPLSSDWLDVVHRPQTQAECDSLQRSIDRGVPYGDDRWTARSAASASNSRFAPAADRNSRPTDSRRPAQGSRKCHRDDNRFLIPFLCPGISRGKIDYIAIIGNGYFIGKSL
jgi:putative transposase